ncbi:MAG: DUF547 domain-containing protein [archaeon]|nr:DUF547 domain-containing protein [archaeon]
MPLVLASTSFCGGCLEAKRLLQQHQVVHRLMDVNDLDTADLVMALCSKSGVPQLFDASDTYMGDLEFMERFFADPSFAIRFQPLPAGVALGSLASRAAHPVLPAAPLPPVDCAASFRVDDFLPPPSPAPFHTSSLSSSTTTTHSTAEHSETDPVTDFFAPTFLPSSPAQPSLGRVFLNHVSQALLFGQHRMRFGRRILGVFGPRRDFSLHKLHKAILRSPAFPAPSDPLQLISALLSEGYIEPVAPSNSDSDSDSDSDHAVGLSLDSDRLFRWYYHQNRHVLNCLYQQPRGAVRDPSAIASELNALFQVLCSRYVTADGRAVDYEAISKSPELSSFMLLVHELQTVDLAGLSPARLKIFFLNLYNTLIIHATIALGAPKTALHRSRFFTSVSYLIHDTRWSLDDIEHGALRSNGRLAGFLARWQWRGSDPRLRYCIPLDPRIHFALVCGAKSCPPLRHFCDDNIDQALDHSTRSFLEQEVSVDHQHKRIVISALFQWYGRDFGQSSQEILRWISQHMPPGTPALDQLDYPIDYSPYDWTSNGRFQPEPT